MEANLLRINNTNIWLCLQALELNPTDKNALVARSKCYLLLGEPELALKDAESALEGDKKFVKGKTNERPFQ